MLHHARLLYQIDCILRQIHQFLVCSCLLVTALVKIMFFHIIFDVDGGLSMLKGMMKGWGEDGRARGSEVERR